MPRTLPNGDHARLEWFRARAPQWAQRAVLLGLSPQQIARLLAELAEAEANHRRFELARTEAADAARAWHASIANLSRHIGAAANKVRAAASTSIDPAAILTAASLPIHTPPRRRGKAPAPGAPRITTLTPDGQGRILIRWKPGTVIPSRRRNNTNLIYTIYRRTTSFSGITSPEERLTSTGANIQRRGTKTAPQVDQHGHPIPRPSGPPHAFSWLDTTLPADARTATYRITARRGNKVSAGEGGGEMSVVLGGAVEPPKTASAAAKGPRAAKTRAA